MRFEADLELVVDGTPAHVSGDGASLIVEAADPAELLRTLRRSGGRPARRRLVSMADGLAERGASVRLQGPHGHIFTVGADADARAFRVLTGTRHAAPGSLRGLLSLVSTTGRERWGPQAVVAAAIVTTMLVALRVQRSEGRVLRRRTGR